LFRADRDRPRPVGYPENCQTASHGLIEKFFENAHGAADLVDHPAVGLVAWVAPERVICARRVLCWAGLLALAGGGDDCYARGWSGRGWLTVACRRERDRDHRQIGS
jgi:hypothetical protein